MAADGFLLAGHEQAGLATECPFDAIGILPQVRPRVGAHQGFQLNYTLWLNIAAPSRSRGSGGCIGHKERCGGGRGYATDVVCGMQVPQANAPAISKHAGTTIYFCSDRCQTRFETDPERVASGQTPEPTGAAAHGEVRDPACRMAV